MAEHLAGTLSLGLVVVIFIASLIWARLEGPSRADAVTEEAEKILGADDEMVAKIDGDLTIGRLQPHGQRGVALPVR